MITLYHAPQSRSSRMIWLLEEIGVKYEIRPVSIYRPMTGEGTGDAVNPHPDKRVPALVHNDVLLSESVAILLYLADTFPEAGLAPLPGDARRVDYLTWVAWYATELEAATFASMAGETAAFPQKRRNYDAVVRRLEDALARGPYLLGDAFSGADFLVSSILAFARHAFPASEAIDAYIARCNDRPAAIRALDLDTASGPQGVAVAA